jgi:hypothetical protein
MTARMLRILGGIRSEDPSLCWPPSCFGDLTAWIASFLGSRQSLSYSRISQYLFEPEVSLPVHKISPLAPILSKMQPITFNPVSLTWILILSTYLRLVPPRDMFHSGFPTKSLYKFRLSPGVLHALPISYSLISSVQLYLAKSTSCEAPRHAVSLTPCYFLPSRSKYSHYPALSYLLFFLCCQRRIFTLTQIYRQKRRHIF